MIKNHAIQLYSEVIKFVKLVLKDIPDEKMDEKIGEAEKPSEILFHLIATPHWWMKQTGKALPFSAKFTNLEEAKILLDKQLEVFTNLLNEDKEAIWTPDNKFSAADKSIAWIMIRSANHMMHHTSMLIYMRHIWGLPSLKNPNWGKIVDMPFDFHY